MFGDSFRIDSSWASRS